MCDLKRQWTVDNQHHSEQPVASHNGFMIGASKRETSGQWKQFTNSDWLSPAIGGTPQSFGCLWTGGLHHLHQWSVHLYIIHLLSCSWSWVFPHIPPSIQEYILSHSSPSLSLLLIPPFPWDSLSHSLPCSLSFPILHFSDCHTWCCPLPTLPCFPLLLPIPLPTQHFTLPLIFLACLFHSLTLPTDPTFFFSSLQIFANILHQEPSCLSLPGLQQGLIQILQGPFSPSHHLQPLVKYAKSTRFGVAFNSWWEVLPQLVQVTLVYTQVDRSTYFLPLRATVLCQLMEENFLQVAGVYLEQGGVGLSLTFSILRRKNLMQIRVVVVDTHNPLNLWNWYSVLFHSCHLLFSMFRRVNPRWSRMTIRDTRSPFWLWNWYSCFFHSFSWLCQCYQRHCLWGNFLLLPAKFCLRDTYPSQSWEENAFSAEFFECIRNFRKCRKYRMWLRKDNALSWQLWDYAMLFSWISHQPNVYVCAVISWCHGKCAQLH